MQLHYACRKTKACVNLFYLFIHSIFFYICLSYLQPRRLAERQGNVRGWSSSITQQIVFFCHTTGGPVSVRLIILNNYWMQSPKYYSPSYSIKDKSFWIFYPSTFPSSKTDPGKNIKIQPDASPRHWFQIGNQINFGEHLVFYRIILWFMIRN